MSDLGNILDALKEHTRILLSIEQMLRVQTGGTRQAESDRAQPPCKADQPLPPRQEGSKVPPMPKRNSDRNESELTGTPESDSVTPSISVPWKYMNVHSCVFNFMIVSKDKRGMGLSRDQAAKATRILKRNGDWTPPKLGALLYAFAQDPLPDDPFTFAGGCLNGKSGARADFERYEKRAADLLRSFEIRVAKDTGAENVEVQSETGDEA